MKYNGWPLWAPNMYCKKCEVAWDYSFSDICWICHNKGQIARKEDK